MARPKKGVNEDKKMQYGIWLGLPAKSRKADEDTIEKFAAKIDVTPMTLSRWKDDPYVIDLAKNAVKMFFGNDAYEVVRTVVEKAKEGSFQHARLFMEYNGDIGTAVRKQSQIKDVKVTFETVAK